MGARLRRKLFVAFAATLVAATGAGLAWRKWVWREDPTVRIVDSSVSLREVLTARRQMGPPTDWTADSGVLTIEPIDAQIAWRFFDGLTVKRNDMIFEPRCYVWRVGSQSYKPRFAEHPDGSWQKTMNSRGLREDREFAPVKTGWRVLVTGDSHVDGVCNNSESLVHVFEREWLACHPGYGLEAINAGLGGYNPYNYLGVFDVFEDLAPDVYVVVVYGGNDFAGMMPLQRFFERRGAMRAMPEDISGFVKERPEFLAPIAQEVHQVLYFRTNPEEVAACVATMGSISLAIERKCAARSCRALFVYLPPAYAAQPRYFAESLATLREFMPFEDEAIHVSDRIADAWLAFLREHDLPSVDLRPSFASANELYYWRTDHHINLAGQRAAGEALLPAIDALLP